MAGDHLFIQLSIAVYVLVNPKLVGITQPIQKRPALETAGHVTHHRAAALVVHCGPDLANVRVNRRTEDDHLRDGNDEREQDGHRVTPHVPDLFVENRAQATEWIGHDAASISACRRWLSSTKASSSVGINGRISSTSTPWRRSSSFSSCSPTDSSTSA